MHHSAFDNSESQILGKRLNMPFTRQVKSILEVGRNRRVESNMFPESSPGLSHRMRDSPYRPLMWFYFLFWDMWNNAVRRSSLQYDHGSLYHQRRGRVFRTFESHVPNKQLRSSATRYVD